MDLSQPEEKRTSQQNRALHLFFRLVADALNDAGYDLRKTTEAMKAGVEIPWTETMVKDVLWREIQITMSGKHSTKELSKKEDIDRIYDVLNRFLARFGIDNVPFPNEENKLNSN